MEGTSALDMRFVLFHLIRHQHLESLEAIPSPSLQKRLQERFFPLIGGHDYLPTLLVGNPLFP